MIKIPADVLRGIYDTAEAAYPYECCGVLIGTTDEKADRTVHTFRRCKNNNKERAADRYDMDPLDFMRAEREFEKSSWEIIGIYHSHPDHPSRASQTDTDRAVEIMAYGWSYIIVSVQNGKMASVQSWVLNETEKRFYEEPLITEGDTK